MGEDVIFVMRAAHFAAERHTGARRKGQRAAPYVNHVIEVAELVAGATGGEDPVLVAAALLHDVVEDGYGTFEEIEALFGPEVASVAREVTDDNSLPTAVRRRLQAEAICGRSDRAKVLRLADKTSNLRSLAADPPSNWSAPRRAEYRAFTQAVAEGCRGVCPMLEAQFDEALAAAEAADAKRLEVASSE